MHPYLVLSRPIYNFIYSSFFRPKLKKNCTFYLFFIDNKKGIAHFKLAPLDYGYSGVYRQQCKVTGNPMLFIALFFCLKFAI